MLQLIVIRRAKIIIIHSVLFVSFSRCRKLEETADFKSATTHDKQSSFKVGDEITGFVAKVRSGNQLAVTHFIPLWPWRFFSVFVLLSPVSQREEVIGGHHRSECYWDG